ncbi:MAG: FMN-binding glutamate synthase family protein [Peptococcaceae bacterium]|nr:FMN-binding glutamate synthase family protein [Peptococcaceae bacterium]
MNRKLVFAVLSLPAYFTFKALVRKSVKKNVNHYLKRLLRDPYKENLAELVNAGKRTSIQNIIEIDLKAAHGNLMTRPLGTSKRFNHFDNLMFLPQPLAKGYPLPVNTPIDLRVVIGPKAQKPLQINIPLMISAMAFGLALNQGAKIALARGAKLAGTAISSGEGPLLPEERKHAGKYILQISRWPWGLRTDKQIAQADMLEVQMGQGADMGPSVVSPLEIKGKARRLMKLGYKQQVYSLPAPPGINEPKDWPQFLDQLRKRSQGIPIALKIMAGRVEEDLDFAIEHGFDAVILDGAQGGSHASPPIVQDDFGIPSIYALMKAVNYLKKMGMKDRISLIVSGGYNTAGDCLKALALGADAIYLGTSVLYASASKQLNKTSPWEPPTELVFYRGQAQRKYNYNLGAESVANMLKSMVMEMEYAMRIMGKKSLKELGPDDLIALDDFSAELTGVKKA